MVQSTLIVHQRSLQPAVWQQRFRHPCAAGGVNRCTRHSGMPAGLRPAPLRASTQVSNVPVEAPVSHPVTLDPADDTPAQVEVPGPGPSDEHQAQQAYVEVEVTTEVEEEVQQRPFNPREAMQSVGTYLTATNVGWVLSGTAVTVLLITLVMAVQKVYQQANTATAKRKRLIDRNKQLVTELSKYLPAARDKLTPNVIRGLRGSTGFTGVEVFRKYLWYVLRERKFDQDAVQDMLALKAAAGLTDADVAEALKQRAQRVYDTYGTLMLNTDGFTTAGLERRATCKALFQKLLFLTETEGLVAQGSEAAKSIDLRTIFGATEEDLDKTRLVSLYDVDLEKAFNQGPGAILDTEAEEDKP